MSTKKIVMMIAALIAVPTAGRAEMDVDSMRCEAQHLRHEGRLYACIARCDQQAAPSDDPSCEESCHTRYQLACERADQNPPCANPSSGTTMNPNECEARMLRGEATLMLCASRCHTRAQTHEGFDEGACVDTCETRYGTLSDAVHAIPGCKYVGLRDDGGSHQSDGGTQP